MATHILQREIMNWAVVAHAFNPALGRQRQVDLCEFEASLAYRASSRLQSYREFLSGKKERKKG